ncbi:glycosyl transferase, group 1 family protein [Novosphingobium nitrogenifigens DSM 19370]|uniref:Glycosyl transferase, group 1 family protein n=1 Tax=Novosphingobium nitrogenifigens DSM 19370 TaxID=983920 RepID=F1Z9G1_9SPHN|nr:glycosyltransferase [Novosphingobium nitrogenifigens]EGD58781.1 glycosyl transferase, group 1 family protein [Novosphingobium nitrogenifigens DSM 19370]
MRLLSIATLYPAAPRPGFGRFVRAQLEALAARDDWDVTVINPIGVPPLLPLRRYAPLRAIPAVETGGTPDHPVTVHHPRFPLIPGLSGRFNPALIARAVLPLAQRLHAERPFDLVDAQFFYPDGPAAARIARALGLPLAIKARGADIHYWGSRPASLAQIRVAARQAKVLLSVSSALAEDMIALGLPASRIHVHYTGLDHARFHPRPRAQARALLAERVPALAFPAAVRIVACVGALIPRKGQAIAIEALRDLDQDVVLVLVGAGPDEAALRQLARKAGLEGRVVFAGALGHDELPLLLNAAEAMVLPSASEGLANAWVEALACGTPIVIPDIGGARELLNRREAGRLAERTPSAVAKGLSEVLAAQAPQTAVAAAAARFSWEANAAALAEIYSAAASR